MKISLVKIIIFLLAYLINSLPISLWLTKIFTLPDPRTYGSGNIGATNVGRKNFLLGILVMFIDISKTYFVLLIAKIFYPEYDLEIFWLICLLGQTQSIFLNFTGGKGVSCFIGGVLALYPQYFLFLFCISVFTIYLTKNIWPASILAVFVFLLYSFNLSFPINFINSIIALRIFSLHISNIMNPNK